MSAKRRSRRDALLREIEELREISFPIPTKGDVFEKEVLEKTKDGIVRGRVLLDCSLIEELLALVMMHHWLSGDPRFGRLRYFGRNKKYAQLYKVRDARIRVEPDPSALDRRDGSVERSVPAWSVSSWRYDEASLGAPSRTEWNVW